MATSRRLARETARDDAVGHDDRPMPSVRPDHPPSAGACAQRITLVARVGVVEATTYLVLVATSLWRALDGPDLGPAVGLTHGIVFLAYAALVLATRECARWSSRTTMALLVASIVPGGGFVVAHRLRHGRI
jgi:integral membrane protein